MKASQSGTERAVSQIKKTVANSYEGKIGVDDMVNIIVILRTNSNIYDMDFKLAGKKYLELGHRPCLKKTKPIDEISTTLKNKEKERLEFTHKKPGTFFKLQPVKLGLVSPKKPVEVKKKERARIQQKLHKFRKSGDDSNVDKEQTFKANRRSNEDEVQEFNFIEDVSNSNNSENTQKRKHSNVSKGSINKSNKKLKGDTANKFCKNENSKVSVLIDSDDEEYRTLPKQVCVDDCRFQEEIPDNMRWIACDRGKSCLSRQSRIKSKFQQGNWFHDQCVGKSILNYSEPQIEKLSFICPSCDKENDIDTSIEEICKITERTEEINVVEKQNTKDAARVTQNKIYDMPTQKKIFFNNQQLKTALKKKLSQENMEFLNPKGNGDFFFFRINRIIWKYFGP